MQFALGALGGVLITGTVALVTSALTRRAERTARQEGRRQSRADLRRSAYVAFVAQVHGIGDETQGWREKTGKHLAQDEVLAAFYRDLGASSHEYDVREIAARLAAGPGVLPLLDRYIDWFRPALGQEALGLKPGLRGSDEKLAPLVAAMRSELDEDMLIPAGKRDRASV